MVCDCIAIFHQRRLRRERAEVVHAEFLTIAKLLKTFFAENIF